MLTFKPLLFATLLGLTGACAAAQAELTPTETRWLKAGLPALNYAKQLGLPVDIIVQPQAGPGDVPMAMGFDGGRCKLVLSMRGNPAAEASLEGVPAELQAVVIEAIAAHEIGHCWRYAQGAWRALPAGFVETGEVQAADQELLALSQAQRENRREEGYADLVALAWTRLKHPQHYQRVHAWLTRTRAAQPVAGGSHDTAVWVRLAADATSFAAAATPFDQVGELWRQGLLSAD